MLHFTNQQIFRKYVVFFIVDVFVRQK